MPAVASSAAAQVVMTSAATTALAVDRWDADGAAPSPLATGSSDCRIL